MLESKAMPDFIELEFHIEDATPTTIPARELLKIVSVWVQELGEHNHVHFKEVREGCVCAVVKINADVFPKTSKRINRQSARDNLNKTLSKYNKFGYIKTANDTQDFQQIDLGGIKLYEKNTITIRDETCIKGRIIEIRGRDKTVNIDILGTSGEKYKCELTDKEAKKLNWGDYIQADVSGEWILLENGQWDTPPRKKLTITKYQKIKMYNSDTLLAKLSDIISDETFDKIQENIALDMKDISS